MSFLNRLCVGFGGLFPASRDRRKGAPLAVAHSGTGICTCVGPSNICTCLRSRGTMVSSTSSENDPAPPRCLLLGLSGSGKSTFLYRIKTGEYFDVQPTNGFLVEEILINKKGDTVTFSEVGGTNRRNIRLQFLQSLPLLGVSILFFIDVTSTPEALQQSFEELIYVISYTQARGCTIHYLGVVLNKQDLLNSPPPSLNEKARKKSLSWNSKGSQQQKEQKQPRVDLDLEKFPEVLVGEKEEKELLDSQSDIVKWIKKEVYEAMEKYKLAQPEEFRFHSELLHTGPDGKGISMRTGDGVQEVYRRLIQGVKAGRGRHYFPKLEKMEEAGEKIVG